MKDVDLDRLLRAASKEKDQTPVEMPLGFDTRVAALSRRNGNGVAFGALLRRVALSAAWEHWTALPWFEEKSFIHDLRGLIRSSCKPFNHSFHYFEVQYGVHNVNVFCIDSQQSVHRCFIKL